MEAHNKAKGTTAKNAMAASKWPTRGIQASKARIGMNSKMCPRTLAAQQSHLICVVLP